MRCTDVARARASGCAHIITVRALRIQIEPYSAGEQQRILRYDGQRLPQRAQADPADVYAINQYFTGGDRDQTPQREKERGLAAARPAHNANLPGWGASESDEDKSQQVRDMVTEAELLCRVVSTREAQITDDKTQLRVATRLVKADRRKDGKSTHQDMVYSTVFEVATRQCLHKARARKEDGEPTLLLGATSNET